MGKLLKFKKKPEVVADNTPVPMSEELLKALRSQFTEMQAEAIRRDLEDEGDG